MIKDLPPVSFIRQDDSHRLIPSKFTAAGHPGLMRIADDDAHLSTILELDHFTDDRLLAEHGLLPGISSQELVVGVPGYRVINAAFTHARPEGSRFNGPDRGAWYASFELATAQAEVAFHKATEYAEIGRFEDTVTYQDYLSDFKGSFHDLRESAGFKAVLSPNSYVTSQQLASRLLTTGSSGIVYPSVRNPGGTCIACFRPPLVLNVRSAKQYQFVWDGSPIPTITCPATTQSA